MNGYKKIITDTGTLNYNEFLRDLNMNKMSHFNQMFKFFVVLLIQFVYCSSAFSQKDGDKYKIVLYNEGNTTAYFSYYDKFSDQISISIPVKQTIVVSTSNPIVLKNSIWLNEAFVFYGADSVNLSIAKNGKCIMTSTHIKPKRAFLKHLKLELGAISDLSVEGMKQQGILLSKPLKRDSVLFLAYQNRLKYLDKNGDTALLESSSKNFAKKYLYYEYLMEKSKHLLLKSFVNNQIPKAYKDSLIRLDQSLNCDDCLVTDTYKSFARNYLDYLHFNTPKDSLLNYIKNRFSGATKDFLLFMTLKYSSNSKPELFKASYLQFLSECSNPDYKLYITKLYDFANIKLKLTNKELLNKDGLIVSFSEVIKKYEGKYIYLDFWASWCGPCMDEMPSSISLSNKYIDKDVVFLYTSLDDNNSKWEAIVKRLDLNPEHNFLLVGGSKSELAKQFKVSSIPQYVFIGKKGEILNTDASRPSDKKTSGMLNKFLNDDDSR